MQPSRSVWAGRFIGLTFALGGVAWAIIAILVLGNVLAGTGNFALGPATSRIVAGGGAGSWFTMGLLSFLLIGIAGMGLSALFYDHVESRLGSPLTGWRNAGAWVHLALGGIGATLASLLMMWGGFSGGAALLPASGGGLGQNNTYVHVNILSPIVAPIAALMGIALLGYLVGGTVLATGWMAARKT